MRPRAVSARAGSCLAIGLVCAPIAPDSAAAQWHVGVQAGLTVGSLSGDFAVDASPAVGGTIGVDFELWIADSWVLDLDLALVQRGAENISSGGRMIDFRLNYLDLPVMLGRAFPVLGGSWQIAPYAGAGLAWVSDCGVRFQGQWQYTTCDVETPGGAPTHLDVSFPLGVAFRHLYPGGSRLSFDVRYAFSTSEVLTPEETSASNRTVQVLFGFVVPLSGGKP